jgi:hypothetical protein
MKYGLEKFDDRLIAVDEFHHVSARPRQQARPAPWAVHRAGQDPHRRHDRLLLPGRRRGRACPTDEAKFDTVTYTYYEQLNGYEYLKQLDIGYFFYSGSLHR